MRVTHAKDAFASLENGYNVRMKAMVISNTGDKRQEERGNECCARYASTENLQEIFPRNSNLIRPMIKQRQADGMNIMLSTI